MKAVENDDEARRIAQAGMNTVGAGFGIALLVQLGVVGLLFLLQALIVVMVFGVAQLLWLVPLAVWFRRRGQRAAAKGVLILMGVSFLVNAACFGLVMAEGFH